MRIVCFSDPWVHSQNLPVDSFYLSLNKASPSTPIVGRVFVVWTPTKSGCLFRRRGLAGLLSMDPIDPILGCLHSTCHVRRDSDKGKMGPAVGNNVRDGSFSFGFERRQPHSSLPRGPIRVGVAVANLRRCRGAASAGKHLPSRMLVSLLERIGQNSRWTLCCR